MPNGGSDCCGTCSHNGKNRGEAGYANVRDPGPGICAIRDLDVSHDPMYTYCANHPAHNRDGITFPVGPVFRAEFVEGTLGYRRVEWVPSPDTPELREQVLAFVEALEPEWSTEYPLGISFAVAAVLQVGHWREVRALPALRRLAETPPVPAGADTPLIARRPEQIIDASREAIDLIEAER